MSHADEITMGDWCCQCGEHLGNGFGCIQLCAACEGEKDGQNINRLSYTVIARVYYRKDFLMNREKIAKEMFASIGWIYEKFDGLANEPTQEDMNKIADWHIEQVEKAVHESNLTRRTNLVHVEQTIKKSKREVAEIAIVIKNSVRLLKDETETKIKETIFNDLDLIIQKNSEEK